LNSFLYALPLDKRNGIAENILNKPMPEVPPSPQAQQPTPEQHPGGSTQVAKRFMHKWDQRLWNMASVLVLPMFVENSLSGFLADNNLHGIFWGLAAVCDTIMVGAKAVSWAKNKIPRR